MPEDAITREENGQQSERKRPRMQESEAPAHQEGEDRLSSLPDDILRSILNLLPVKYAVGATFLSRRWSHLLPTIDLLDLSPAALSGEGQLDAWGWISAAGQAIESDRFPVRRCKIINPGGGPPAGEGYFGWWVRALAHRAVRELEIADVQHSVRVDQAWDAAAVLGRCRALRRLELQSCSLYLAGHIPSGSFSCSGGELLPTCGAVRCRGLRELRLERTALCDHFFEAIVANCPRIQKLELIRCTGARTYRIAPAPQLRSLLLAAAGRTRAVVVDAPGLTTLRLQLTPQMETLEIRTPALRELQLHLMHGWRPETYRRMSPLLGELLSGAGAGAGLTTLTFRGMSADCLSIYTEVGFVPRFRRLRRLFVSVALVHCRHFLFLAALLENCECLQQLNITIARQQKGWHSAPLADETLHVLSCIIREKLKRSPCLNHHLQEITMSGFKVSGYQLALAGFFLREAKVLKSMTLTLGSKCSEAAAAEVRGLLSSSLGERTSSSQVRLVVKQAGGRRGEGKGGPAAMCLD